jgi:hypothetical protein
MNSEDIEEVVNEFLQKLENSGLPKYPQTVRVLFSDGSTVLFENANHITYDDAKRVLIMTQNCGNHTFDIVGAKLKYYKNPSLNDFDR